MANTYIDTAEPAEIAEKTRFSLTTYGSSRSFD